MAAEELVKLYMTTLRGPTVVDMRLGAFQDKLGREVRRARLEHPKSDDAEWTTPERWFAIWMEEVLEVVQAWNDRKPREELLEELVQVGAMTMRLWGSVQS